MTHVIHFTELTELVDELPQGHTVRVAALDVTESTRDKYGIRLAGIGVHVRAILDGSILSCYIPVKRIQMILGVSLNTSQKDDYNDACDKAEALAAEISTYLEEHGLRVRPGVIDLGSSKPMHGRWTREDNKTLRDENMAIVSFSMTTEQYRTGQKTVTRRFWKRSYAERWQRWWDEGHRIHQAYDKQARFGGVPIGGFRLTCRPYFERLSNMPVADLVAEGGMCETLEEFIQFVGKSPDDEALVIRFERL